MIPVGLGLLGLGAPAGYGGTGAALLNLDSLDPAHGLDRLRFAIIEARWWGLLACIGHLQILYRSSAPGLTTWERVNQGRL